MQIIEILPYSFIHLLQLTAVIVFSLESPAIVITYIIIYILYNSIIYVDIGNCNYPQLSVEEEYLSIQDSNEQGTQHTVLATETGSTKIGASLHTLIHPRTGILSVFYSCFTSLTNS